jgi:hypothetical protein
MKGKDKRFAYQSAYLDIKMGNKRNSIIKHAPAAKLEFHHFLIKYKIVGKYTYDI